MQQIKGRDLDNPNNEALDWLDSKAQKEDEFLAFSIFFTQRAQLFVTQIRYEKTAQGVKPGRPSWSPSYIPGRGEAGESDEKATAANTVELGLVELQLRNEKWKKGTSERFLWIMN